MAEKPDEATRDEAEVSTWRCPHPRQLPELRGKLASWLAQRGAAYYLGAMQTGSQQIRPPGRWPASAARLAVEEYGRVADGDVYWVSTEMTQLAQQAGRQIRSYELYEHDLAGRNGFMVFQSPLATTNSNRLHVQIVAVSWGIVRPPLLLHTGPTEIPVGDDWPDPAAVWFTFYSHPQTVIQANTHRINPIAKAAMLQDVGPFMPDNELVWPFSRTEDLPEGEDYTSAWGQIVLAAFLLMKQPLAARSTETTPRPARRRLQKAKLPTSDVQLIHIRRPQRRPSSQPSPSPGGGREYSVQWWTAGHWRRYHVGPGRARIERRWISPYLAGPDDKPVRGTDRVKVWDR